MIFDLINKISYENNKKWIGWKGEVLFDEKSEEGIKGRNFAYKPIFVKEKVEIGQNHLVEIIDSTNHSLDRKDLKLKFLDRKFDSSYVRRFFIGIYIGTR